MGSRAVDALDERLPSWALNLASRAIGSAARIRLPPPINRLAISAACRAMRVDSDELPEAADSYRCLDELFTRPMRAGARSFAIGLDGLTSPCDGFVSGAGPADPDGRVRVKGHDWTLTELLGDRAGTMPSRVELLVVYLEPGGYHRVHAPCDAIVERVDHRSGERRRVDAAAIRRHPDRLARNERLVFWMTTRWGPLALVMVAAAGVGNVASPYLSGATPQSVERGDELGRFHLGSSVVLVAPDTLRARVYAGERVRVGSVAMRRPS